MNKYIQIISIFIFTIGTTFIMSGCSSSKASYINVAQNAINVKVGKNNDKKMVDPIINTNTIDDTNLTKVSDNNLSITSQKNINNDLNTTKMESQQNISNTNSKLTKKKVKKISKKDKVVKKVIKKPKKYKTTKTKFYKIQISNEKMKSNVIKQKTIDLTKIPEEKFKVKNIVDP